MGPESWTIKGTCCSQTTKRGAATLHTRIIKFIKLKIVIIN